MTEETLPVSESALHQNSPFKKHRVRDDKKTRAARNRQKLSRRINFGLVAGNKGRRSHSK